MDHYAVRFLMHTRESLGQPLDLDDARSRLQRLVRAAGDDGADPCPDDAEVRSFALFAGRCQAFLDDLASTTSSLPRRSSPPAEGRPARSPA